MVIFDYKGITESDNAENENGRFYFSQHVVDHIGSHAYWSKHTDLRFWRTLETNHPEDVIFISLLLSLLVAKQGPIELVGMAYEDAITHLRQVAPVIGISETAEEKATIFIWPDFYFDIADVSVSASLRIGNDCNAISILCRCKNKDVYSSWGFTSFETTRLAMVIQGILEKNILQKSRHIFTAHMFGLGAYIRDNDNPFIVGEIFFALSLFFLGGMFFPVNLPRFKVVAFILTLPLLVYMIFAAKFLHDASHDTRHQRRDRPLDESRLGSLGIVYYIIWGGVLLVTTWLVVLVAYKVLLSVVGTQSAIGKGIFLCFSLMLSIPFLSFNFDKMIN